MRKIILLIVILVSITFQSCDFLDGTPLWLDNPTDKAITVKIDEESYEVAPGDLLRIESTKGKHRFTDSFGKEHDIEITEPSLINSTNETYIVQNVEYSTSGTSRNLPETKVIEVNGIKYNGNFEVYKDKVVPHGNINNNVITPLKDDVEFTGSKNYIILNKMYRSKDFLSSADTKEFKQ